VFPDLFVGRGGGIVESLYIEAVLTHVDGLSAQGQFKSIRACIDEDVSGGGIVVWRIEEPASPVVRGPRDVIEQRQQAIVFTQVVFTLSRSSGIKNSVAQLLLHQPEIGIRHIHRRHRHPDS